MGASINRGPKNKPKYLMVLVVGSTKMRPLIFGNSHIEPHVHPKSGATIDNTDCSACAPIDLLSSYG